jgi:hypothetical protein
MSFPQGPLIPSDLSATDAVFNGDILVIDSISATTMTAVTMDVGSLIVDSISTTTLVTTLFNAGSGMINSTGTTLGLFGATPVVQPTTGLASASRIIVGTATVNVDDTFGGYTIGQVVTALKGVGILD